MTKTKTYDYFALADALISTGAVTDLATDDNGWKRLALMLADLGESARPIFNKISASARWTMTVKNTYSLKTFPNTPIY